MRTFDVAVVGAGQAALAAGYFLRRTGLRFALFDAEPAAGGAWRHTWPSLHLFSPARWSSLPGWLMPASEGPYPSREETLAYLAEYERRYELPIERPVWVASTHADGIGLRLVTGNGQEIAARVVISATGTWSAPVLPVFEGQDRFTGEIIHSAHYAGPTRYAGKRVLVIGAGNSGAQIFADLVDHARVTWVTKDPPVFLPDHVDGQYLFAQATARYQAIKEGRTPAPPRSLGDVVMVPAVRALRDRGLLSALPLFRRFTPDGVEWPDGHLEAVDAVILATGFRPALAHLAPLATPNEHGRLAMEGAHASAHPRLYPLGYGDWTGFASATLIGVGRSAKQVVTEIETALK